MGLLSSYVTSCIERKSGARQRPIRRKVPIGLHFGMVPCFHTQLYMHFFENTSVGTTQINCSVNQMHPHQFGVSSFSEFLVYFCQFWISR